MDDRTADIFQSTIAITFCRTCHRTTFGHCRFEKWQSSSNGSLIHRLTFGYHLDRGVGNRTLGLLLYQTELSRLREKESNLRPTNLKNNIHTGQHIMIQRITTLWRHKNAHPVPAILSFSRSCPHQGRRSAVSNFPETISLLRIMLYFFDVVCKRRCKTAEHVRNLFAYQKRNASFF